MTTTPSAPTLDRSGLPDFLEGFFLVHDGMRRDAARLPGAVERATAVPGARGLARWFEHFRAEIEHHHHSEDDIVWPELAERAPDFAAALAELDQDHLALDEALARTAEALTALASRPSDAITRRAAADAARNLADLLVAHLQREEAAAFPRIARTYTAEEYQALEQRLLKGTSIRQLAFKLPWAFDGVDEATMVRLIAGVPAPIRALYRFVFSPSYRRLCAPLTAMAS